MAVTILLDVEANNNVLGKEGKVSIFSGQFCEHGMP